MISNFQKSGTQSSLYTLHETNMAQPDRDTQYMQEQFGTTSLITDYTLTKNNVLTLEDIKDQLRHLASTTLEELDETLETQLQDLDDNPRAFEESRSLVTRYLVEYGFNSGIRNTANLILTYLEKLQ